MRRARLYRYQVPMDAGVVLRNQRLKSRIGLVVHLEQDDRTGEGEIAPLPGFSLESIDQAESIARLWLTQWAGGNEMSFDGVPPSVAFGLSCALAESDGRMPMPSCWQSVPLCTGDPDLLFDQLSSLPGRKIAKIKVGLYEPIRDSLLVNTLLEALGDLHLRLDANRTWTPDKAASFLRWLNPAVVDRIDFIEEPCASPAQSLAFAAESGIPIAWDETSRESGFSIEALPGVAAVVIKPTLTGSLAYCQQRIAGVHQAGMVALVSSALESSLGLGQLSGLAQRLTPDAPPGLDTLSLMQAQVVRPWPASTLPLLDYADLSLIGVVES